MTDQDPKTPDQGPVPDPHADKPAPRPDPHTRPEPGARVRRPDQDEDLGPLPELFGAAGVEAATWVSDDPELREEAIRRGAEAEGLETAQIFGLLVATVVVLVLIVVAVAVMMTRTGVVEEERRLGTLAYPELDELRRADQERLTTYGRFPGEDRYFIPLDRAQQAMAAEARQRQEVGDVPSVRLPESRRAFNLSYAGNTAPGLVPAPGSPAAEVGWRGRAVADPPVRPEAPDPAAAEPTVDAPATVDPPDDAPSE